MTALSEKQRAANTEGESISDYQKHRKTHIFFGGNYEGGTHSKGLEPESVGTHTQSRESNLSNPTQRPYHAYVCALVPCMSRESIITGRPSAPKQLLNLRGERVDNH